MDTVFSGSFTSKGGRAKTPEHQLIEDSPFLLLLGTNYDIIMVLSISFLSEAHTAAAVADLALLEVYGLVVPSIRQRLRSKQARIPPTGLERLTETPGPGRA